MNYAVFNPSTGEISRVLMLPPGMIVLNLNSGEEYIATTDSVDGNKHRVVAGEIVDRPTMPFSTVSQTISTSDVLHVEDIPEGTVLTYSGGELTIDDGFIDWDSDVPGLYVFTFRLFPYQDAVLYATVTEP